MDTLVATSPLNDYHGTGMFVWVDINNNSAGGADSTLMATVEEKRLVFEFLGDQGDVAATESEGI